MSQPKVVPPPLFGHGAPSMRGSLGQQYYDMDQTPWQEYVWGPQGVAGWNMVGSSGGGGGGPSWLPPGAIFHADFVNGHYYANGAVVDDPATLMVQDDDYYASVGVISSEGWSNGGSGTVGFVLPSDIATALISAGATSVVVGTISDNSGSFSGPEFWVSPDYASDWWSQIGSNNSQHYSLTADNQVFPGYGGLLSCVASTFGPGPKAIGSVNGSPALSSDPSSYPDFNSVGFFVGGTPLAFVQSITIYPPVPDAQLPSLSGAPFLALGPNRVVELTSGASQVDVPLPTDPYWTNLLVKVTSGGTMGTEVVNLPNPVLDGDNTNAAIVGKQVVVQVVDQVDGSDAVHSTINGGATASCYDAAGTSLGNNADINAVLLDYQSATVLYEWQGERWAWDNSVYNNDSTVQVKRVPLPAGGTTGQAPLKQSNDDGDVAWGDVATIVQDSWIPTVSFGGDATGITYDFQNGVYYKVGNMVIAQFRVGLSNIGSGVGSLRIGGLPFAASNLTPAFSSVLGRWITALLVPTPLTFEVQGGQTYGIVGKDVGGSISDLTNVDVANFQCNFIGQAIYFV